MLDQAPSRNPAAPLLIELPAVAASALVDDGLAVPATSASRDIGGAVDVAVAVAGVVPPTVIVAVARQSAGLIARRLIATLSDWWKTRDADRRHLVLEVDQRKRMTRVSIEVTGDEHGEAVVALSRTLERFLDERPPDG